MTTLQVDTRATFTVCTSTRDCIPHPMMSVKFRGLRDGSYLSRLLWRMPVWQLPRPVLRLLLKTTARSSYRHYAAMRVTPPAARESNSLVPFDTDRCIYVHIPKAAGISVKESLFGCRGGGHLPLRIYELIFSPLEFAEYFKFAFVRNPWDRVFSAFTYLKAGGGHAGDRKWADQHLNNYADFGSFVRQWLTPRNIYTEKHFIPQHEFICLRGQLVLDFVGYYESLTADFAKVCRRFHRTAALTWRNRTPREGDGYRAHYTEDMRRIVADVYRKDIELLGYDFESTGIRLRPGASAGTRMTPGSTNAVEGGNPNGGQ
jgi:hypothetical protein